jgi:hypothetical protein
MGLKKQKVKIGIKKIKESVPDLLSLKVKPPVLIKATAMTIVLVGSMTKPERVPELHAMKANPAAVLINPVKVLTLQVKSIHPAQGM